MPKKMRTIGMFCGLLFVGCSSSLSTYFQNTVFQEALTAEGDVELEDAIFLYKRSYGEKLRAATDANERFETLVGDAYLKGLYDDGHFAFAFDLGDEGFEAELDYLGGFGLGQRVNLNGAPALNRRIHEGELGGPDASSCRACHFSGGPDGAGEEWMLDAGEVARVLSNVAVCFVKADSLARAVAVAKAAGAVDPSEGKPKEVLRVAEQLLEWEAQGGTLEEGMARLGSEG